MHKALSSVPHTTKQTNRHIQSNQVWARPGGKRPVIPELGGWSRRTVHLKPAWISERDHVSEKQIHNRKCLDSSKELSKIIMDGCSTHRVSFFPMLSLCDNRKKWKHLRAFFAWDVLVPLFGLPSWIKLPTALLPPLCSKLFAVKFSFCCLHSRCCAGAQIQDVGWTG